MTSRIAAVTAASSSSGRSIVGTALVQLPLQRGQSVLQRLAD
jgi:hypothetical protein